MKTGFGKQTLKNFKTKLLNPETISKFKRNFFV